MTEKGYIVIGSVVALIFGVAGFFTGKSTVKPVHTEPTVVTRYMPDTIEVARLEGFIWELQDREDSLSDSLNGIINEQRTDLNIDQIIIQKSKRQLYVESKKGILDSA